MGSFENGPQQTRREFLRTAAQLGAGASALVALGPVTRQQAAAQGSPSGRGTVRVADISEASVADFSRGEGRNVRIESRHGRAEVRAPGGGEFVSGPVALPFQATHLGLHWRALSVSPRALSVGVRTSVDGQKWDEWRSLSIEAIADLSGSGSPSERSIPIHGHGHSSDSAGEGPARREVFASLVHAGAGHLAQYRVTFSGDEDAALETMTVTALDATGEQQAVAIVSSTDGTVTFTGPDGSSINVVTREDWGCDESLRFSRRGAEIWPEMYVPSKKVVLHHTATSNDYSNGAAEVRAIYTYHARTLGWGDIGYHVLIDRFGTIYEGRHGRGEDPATREILGDDVVAGHVLAHNYGSTGIAAIGNHDLVDPSPELLAAVENAMVFECSRQFIDPAGMSDFLRSDAVWHDMLDNISGHQDSFDTICPGRYLYPHLSALRSAVAVRLAGNAPTLTETTGAANELVAPANLAFSWSSNGLTYSYCLEGWDKPSTSENITYLTGYGAGGYNDSLAKMQTWSEPSTATSASCSNLAAGRYTMHVRDADGRYVASRTYLVKAATTTKGKKPRR